MPALTTELFRSSRPDYIETAIDVSPNRQQAAALFRSSRPDYIETTQVHCDYWVE